MMARDAALVRPVEAVHPGPDAARLRAVRELEDVLARSCSAGAVGCDLAPLARHILATPGKRVRGRLTLACASLGGAGRDDPDAVRAAAAVELLHEASLVHDDVCDRSLVRRGAPSIAAAFGMRTAARFGIWLAARSLALIGELEARRNLGLELAPLTALVEGQLLETARRGATAAERRDHYLAVVRAKTGALMRMACDAGARLAGLSSRERAALATFADAFGTAFQVCDDIRDVEAPASLGKPGGSDLLNGVCTWPILEWLTDHPTSALPALAALPPDAQRAALDATGALHRARGFAASELSRARHALLPVPDGPGRAWLLDLTEIAA